MTHDLRRCTGPNLGQSLTRELYCYDALKEGTDMKIFKNTIPVDDQWHLRTGTPLHVESQDPGELTYWFTSDSETVQFEYRIFGTGHEAVGAYVGTGVDGPFVWHLFKRRVQR